MMKPSAVYSRQTTTKFGKIWRSLAAKWQGSPTSTDHETGHIWCFQSYIWKIQGSTCASLLAVVFNCKHQRFIACKFSNRSFLVQLCTGNVRRTYRAFQRLGPCLLSSWQHQDPVWKDRIFMEVMMVMMMVMMMMMMVMILVTTLKIILLLLLMWMLMLMVVVMMTSKDCHCHDCDQMGMAQTDSYSHTGGSEGILFWVAKPRTKVMPYLSILGIDPHFKHQIILHVHIFTLHICFTYTSLYEHLIWHSIYIYIMFSASYLHHLKSSEMQYRMI